MKVKVNILIILIMWSLPQMLSAQATRAITLKESVALATANSPALLASRARIDQALADYQEAKDRKLPDAKISGSYLRLGSANIDIKSSQNNSGAGPVANQAIYGIANLSMPLYAGGRIRYGIESAALLKQAAEMTAMRDSQQVVTTTVEAYTNLYKAGLTIDLLKKEIEAGIQRDSNLSKLEQNGLLTRNDLMKAELQTSTLRLNELEAESNRNLAGILLAILTGLPEQTMLLASNDLTLPAQAPDFADLENIALGKRADVVAGTLQSQAAAFGIKSAKAEAYPTIALTGGYIAADIPKVLTISNAINLGIGIQYNLSALWKKNTSLQKAMARQSMVNSMNQQLANGIKVQLNTTYQRYLLATKRITLYQESVAQAGENRRIVKDKMDNQLATLPELLEADAAVLQANINMETARADAVMAYYNLQLAAGTFTLY